MIRSLQNSSPKTVISAAASVAATAVLVRSFAKDFIPYEFQQFLFMKFRHLLSTFSNEMTLVIDEFDGLHKNKLFAGADIYLGTILSPSTKRFRVSLPGTEKKFSLSMERNEEICDKFGGFQLKWRMVSKHIQPRYVSDYNPVAVSELRYYELKFHKKHTNKVLQEYLPFVLEKSLEAKEEKKTLKLFTLANDRMVGPRIGPWQSVNLDHPATFDTLAMDMDKKKMIIDDLDMFVERKELYRKVGKAWKRGYLLFGPPGTGKSSLIAAMANYLRFDVYDLQLTDIRNNSELRRLLISTANHSILVVEDIDCSIELTEKRSMEVKQSMFTHPYSQGNSITLSGLLNFIDGLWSSCGDERIIVFTTNHKEKLDEALLRPGRMDVHIHLSYCTPCGFKLLASNYLGITEHPLLLDIEHLLGVTKVTPAEVGEQLLKNNEPEIALKTLIEFLESKKNTAEVEPSEKPQVTSKEPSEKLQEISNAELLPRSKGGKIAMAIGKGDIGLEILKQIRVLPAEVKKELMKGDVAGFYLKGLIELLNGEKENGNMKGDETKTGASSTPVYEPVSEEKNGESNSGST